MKIEELDVFRLSHELTLKTYRITKDFLNEEKFGLTTQMRGSLFSISLWFLYQRHIMT